MKKPTLAQAILMLIVAIIITIAFVSCHKEDVEWNTFEYTVSQGETLWEIAKEYCPEDMDCREYIYEVKELNNMTTSDLYIGQTITLLTTEKDLIDMYDVVDIEENGDKYTITLNDGNYYEWAKGEN
jgi:uncharacterized protein YpuA (DUF1002 family)